MTHRILHESHRFNANTANTHAICKNAFYVGWWVKAGSTQLLSSRACLYINRHESCCVSVSSNVCAAAYEHRAERGGVKFKDAFAFWFAAVPFEQLLTLYTCTHTFKVSFSQRGTLAFAACLSNLTSKGLGHLSLSLSLSLSLISPCAHAHEITLFQRARVYHAPEGSRLRSETQLRSREAGAYVIFQQTRKKRSSSEDRCLRSKLLCKCFCWHQ